MVNEWLINALTKVLILPRGFHDFCLFDCELGGFKPSPLHGPLSTQVADCVIGVPSYYSDVHRQVPGPARACEDPSLCFKSLLGLS